MQPQPPPYDPSALDAFVTLAGARLWAARLAQVHDRAAIGRRAGQAVRLRHGLELAIERLRGVLTRAPLPAELHAARLAAEVATLSRRLNAAGRSRLRERLRTGLKDEGTLVPLFHLARTATLQASRGFDVEFPGLAEAAPYDLLIRRGTVAAEIACDVVSAEEGRLVRRAAWSHLADRVDQDLRSWLPASPGRYLLKMTLPEGLDDTTLVTMHDRIRRLLATGGRREQDATAVLRLEPLMVDDSELMPSLRREFGPEAHLAVTAAGRSVFAMAARAGRADEVAAATRRRLFEIAPTRLSGTRPGILAMFIDDTDSGEWRGLRERLELEGEVRQFLAYKAARPVIAVTCASRCELFGTADAAEEGELRFRNSAHPAARATALEPAILSSV